MTNTNCAAKVRECTGLESPLTPLTRGERAGSGGILHAQEFVNSGSAAEAFERLEASKIAVAAAQRNFDAAQESLREGVGTIVEVLTAQLALITAETNLVQATYDAAVAELQLRVATGERLPVEP